MNRTISLLLLLLLVLLSSCEKETIRGKILTLEVSYITTSTAVCSGYVQIDKAEYVTSQMCGVVWNTIPNILPVVESDYSERYYGEAGNFTVEMKGLDSKTTYYVRAYVRIKDVIVYGEIIEFTTE